MPEPATKISQKSVAAPKQQSRRRAWWHFAGALVFYSVIVLAGLEAFFAWSGVGQEEFLEPDPVFGCRHIPNKKVVWRMEGFSADTLNSAGLRDVEHAVAKPPGTYRIALLGDSATEGLQVNLNEVYGRRLEEMLNRQAGAGKHYEVINFACSSYSTGQEVLQFEQQVKAYQPDLTILLYNRGDNVENIRNPAKLDCEPRPYFYLDAAGNLQQDNLVLAAQAEKLKPNKSMDFWRRQSRLYGVLSHANLTLSISDGFYRKVRGLLLSPFKTKNDKKVPVAERPYPEQESWPVTRKLLERLAADCRQEHSQLLIVIFPNLLGDMEFAQQASDLSGLVTSHPEQAGFKLIDLTGDFKGHPDANSLFLKYHFSAAGHKLVADLIAKDVSKQ